jgi:hypothetical protein
VSSSQLTKNPDRARSFGGYNTHLVPFFQSAVDSILPPIRAKWPYAPL